MRKYDTLNDTLSQYPPELMAILGDISITDAEGLEMMRQIDSNNACAGSDGSVKDGLGGHAFCITDNSFTTRVWGHAQTVGIKHEMSSLRTDNGGALAILLVIHALQIHFPSYSFPSKLDIWVDN